MPAWLEINEPPWIPLYSYYVGQVVLDALLHTQMVTVAGTSGSSTPVFSAVGGSVVDGTVTWTDQGLGGIAGLGITDRTGYLWMGGGDHDWSLQLRQRGTGSIDLNIANTYCPYMGTQVFLYDVTSSGSTRVFGGTIDEIETRWVDRNARRIVTLRIVSFEQVFDTMLVPARLYENETAGFIFNDLLSLVTGSPITAGTISAGATIVTLLCDGTQTISEVYSQLAQASGYIWGVKISDLTAYFQAPSTTPAPFSLGYATVLMDSLTLNESRQQFRTWQGITMGQDAFAHSAEFFIGAGQKTFTLKRPVSSVTNVWVVYPPGSQNFADGLFTGIPSDGDTITFSFPNSGSIYNWAAAAPYSVGQIVIDDAGHVQRCTFAGTSDGIAPTWNDAGGVTYDNTVIWQDDGPAGFATDSLITYTFKNVLDNRLFGQVLIATTAADQALYLIQAINASADAKGLTYSLPTWENPLVNADEWLVTGAVTVRNKAAGQGYVAALAESCSNFTWSDTLTSGGGTGHTLVIPIGVLGTTTQGFVYTPGSAEVSLATPLNVGSSLQVEYIRADVGLIAVQDDALIAQRALIEDGTGLYQQVADGTNSLVQTSNVTGLLFAQQALAAFSQYPKTMTFDTYVPGLLPGQYIAAVMNYPLAANVLLNGNWVVQEVNATLVACQPYLSGFGHYRYTVRLINIGQTVSYLDFWEGLGGGSGSGGGQGSAFGGGSQPSILQAPVTIEGATVAPTLTLIQNTPSDGWSDLTAYNVNDTILDFNGHIQLCTIGGTSGAAEPYPWNAAGGTTADGTITWVDQGGNGGLSLLAGNGRFLYNCTMGAANFPDNTGSGTAGHFGVDALITGLAQQLYVRNTVGTPMLTFDASNTRILSDARVSITESSAFDALTITQNGSSKSGIYCAGSVRMVIPPAGAPGVSAASEVKFYADAGGILQISQNGGAYAPIPAGGGISGSDTQIQYNNAGVFGASASLTWTNGSTLLRVIGTARINALNFPDNTGSGSPGNFGMDASINGLASLLYVRDTSGTPMLTFDSNNTRILSVSTMGITVTASVDALAITQNGAGSGLYCAGFMQLVTPPAGTPAVSAATQARIYCDAAGVLKVSQNGAAYVNLVSSGGTPGGSNTQVQFNNAGAFGGSASLTWSGTIFSAFSVLATNGLTVSSAGLVITAGGLTVTAGGIAVTAGNVDLAGGDVRLGGFQRISNAGAGFLTALTISTSGILVSAGGITVTGGITVSTGGIGITASNVDISAGNLLLSGVTRITNAGGAVLTAMTMNGNAGFTGTLAAAVAGGANVDNGIIY